MRVFCIIFIVLLTLVPSVFASGKLGINIAGKYDDFASALSFAGENGWIVVASEPTEELASYIVRAHEKKVHVIIRGHYPSVALTTTYAQQWVNFFATHNFTNRVYFIPVNEPNNAQENIDSIASVKEYSQYLLDQITRYNLRKTSVYILAPALDMYELADTNNAVYKKMGGAAFFKQFDGLPLHLYVEFTPQGSVDASAHPYKKGDWRKIIADLQLTDMPIFIDETGIRCYACTTPDTGGKDKVKYPYGATYQAMYANFLTYVKNEQDWGNAQVRTFNILSYDPKDFSRSSWLSEADTQILSNFGGTVGHTEDNAYATLHDTQSVFTINTNSSLSQTQAKTSLFGSTTDTFLINAGQAKPAAFFAKDTGMKGVFSQKEGVENADFARSGQISSTAETVEEKKGFWEKIQVAVTNLTAAFGFILDSATVKDAGYAYSLSPQEAHTSFRGKGAELFDLSSESEDVHSKILEWYTPYTMRHAISRSAPLGTTQSAITEEGTEDVVPETGATSDIVPSQTSSDAARKLFLITGYACGWARVEGVIWTEKLTVPVTSYRYECLQKQLTDEDGRPFLMSKGAYDIMVASAKSYDYLQCVGFAMASQIEKITSTFLRLFRSIDVLSMALEGRNAKDYCAYGEPRGFARFKPDSKDDTGGIRVGDLVVWTYAPWGHIAVVGKVNPKNKTLSVYEANWGGKGVVHTRETEALKVDCYLRSK